MSHFCDDGYEMLTNRDGLDEAAIAAILAGGQPDSEELATLTELVRSIRFEAASTKPQPSAELAAVLAEGLATDKGELPATAASNVTGPAPQASGLPKWRRTRAMLEIALAKLASLGLAAKVGIAGAAVAAATTGAGAAGVLPGPVQDAVSDTVGAVTPFEFPDSSDRGGDVADDRSGVDGAEVAEDATDDQPGVDGREVAEDASDGRSSAGDGDLPEESQVPDEPASQGSEGLDRARDTEAGEHMPETLPGSSDTADQYRPDDPPSDAPADDQADTPDSTGSDSADGAGDGSAPDDTPTDGTDGQETADGYTPDTVPPAGP